MIGMPAGFSWESALVTGLAQGIAFLHAADDADLLRLMDERMHSTDPDNVIRDLDLRTDLARLRRSWRPTQDDLVGAPRLQLSRLVWSPFVQPFTVSAAGMLLDANDQPTGCQRITRFLIAADAAHGRWIRTWNRFCQLAPHERQRYDANGLGQGDGR